MEQLADHPVIRAMERTGYPPRRCAHRGPAGFRAGAAGWDPPGGMARWQMPDGEEGTDGGE